jgi:hypothetical protein
LATTGSTPAPRTPPPEVVEKPVTPVTPVLPGAPVPPRRASRQRWVSIVGSLLLAGLAALVLLVWPRESQPVATPNAGESAEGAIGAAPGTGATTGSAPSGGTGAPAAGASAGAGGGTETGASGAPSASVTTGPTAQSGALAVSSRITSGLLVSSVEITIRNSGGATVVWHSVTLQLSEGVNLGVSSSEPSVAYSRQGGAHCFVPADGSLKPGESVTFTASVAGLLNSIGGTPLDTAPCPT